MGLESKTSKEKKKESKKEKWKEGKKEISKEADARTLLIGKFLRPS